MVRAKIAVIPFATLLLILLSQSTSVIAAPTWKPKFDASKTVYVDPAMSGHPVAPYQFSPKLEAQLSKESKEGLRYFVVAAQQGDEPIPTNQPLGIAKVDELLPFWTNQPDFPKENYVVIFWVRKAENLNKGSVGVNVGKVSREAGVTPDQLSSPRGLVIPALKANMPADPEGAMMDIVSNIEGQVFSHREALAVEVEQRERDKITDQQRKEQKEKVNQNFKSGLRWLMKTLPFAGGIGGVAVIVMTGRKRKSTALSHIDEWSKLCQNTSNLYLEVEKNELPKIQTLPLDADICLKSKFELLITNLADFMARSSIASELLSHAQELLSKGDARKAISTLTKDSVTVDNNKIPVVLASLQDGIDVTQEMTATELKSGLNYQWQSIRQALNELLTAQKVYLEFSKAGAFVLLKSHGTNHVNDSLPDLNTYNLNKGTFHSVTHGFEELVTEYEGVVQEAELQFSTLKIASAIESIQKANSKLERLDKRLQKALIDKKTCENVTEEHFSGKPLAAKITQATTAIEQINRDFPNESISRYEGRLNEAVEVKDNRLSKCKEQFFAQYQHKHFGEARQQLQKARSIRQECLQNLDGIIDFPKRLQEKKQMLSRKLESINRRNQALKSRHQLDIGTLAWGTLSLDTLSFDIDQLESSVTEAETQQRRELSSSNSSWPSSSGSDGSWSSSGGSDFGSSSGGSDFGSSSGGGDY